MSHGSWQYKAGEINTISIILHLPKQYMYGGKVLGQAKTLKNWNLYAPVKYS